VLPMYKATSNISHALEFNDLINFGAFVRARVIAMIDINECTWKELMKDEFDTNKLNSNCLHTVRLSYK